MKREIQLGQILCTKSQLRFQVMVHARSDITDWYHICMIVGMSILVLLCPMGDRSAQYYRKPVETIKAWCTELNLASNFISSCQYYILILRVELINFLNTYCSNKLIYENPMPPPILPRDRTYSGHLESRKWHNSELTNLRMIRTYCVLSWVWCDFSLMTK